MNSLGISPSESLAKPLYFALAVQTLLSSASGDKQEEVCEEYKSWPYQEKEA